MVTAEDRTTRSESYCSHYGRDTCVIHFKCCAEKDWYPCHKCHNDAIAKLTEQQDKELGAGNQESSESGGTRDQLSNGESGEDCENIGCEIVSEAGPQNAQGAAPKLAHTETTHSMATGLDGSLLRCTGCGEKQTISQYCMSCGKCFAEYFCTKCQLLIEDKVDPYHCDACKTCRANKGDHFHCDTCNVCMALILKDNHKCFADRGHDPCAICWEEVFSGAVILPCFHMVHKDCAIKLILSGSVTCPMCRNPIIQDKQEGKGPPTPSGLWNILSRLVLRFASFAATNDMALQVPPNPHNTALQVPPNPQRNEHNGSILERIGACFRFPPRIQNSSIEHTLEDTEMRAIEMQQPTEGVQDEEH